MDRYSSIKIIRTLEDKKRRYENVKYPLIPPSSLDIYVYTVRGDRYDSLWWVISRSNPSQETDTLYPIVGSQIRIPAPSRIPDIVGSYKSFNNVI